MHPTTVLDLDGNVRPSPISIVQKNRCTYCSYILPSTFNIYLASNMEFFTIGLSFTDSPYYNNNTISFVANASKYFTADAQNL